MKKMVLSFLWLLLLMKTVAGHVYNAVETEMFSIPISPNLFNWTYQEFDQQYRFHASLIGKPELPTWLRYIYSGRHHSGFIFGTPPRNARSPITIEVIGLNRQDYETRRVLLTLKIQPKEKLAKHEVELKIDNLNVEDLLDEHRMTRLKNILRTKLWTESSEDLYATFLASAIDLGARLPLKPGDGEGLVIRLGSAASFSSEVVRLREEVRPLSRLPSCPRDYKRTTVERLFRDAGFALDWCSFELYNTVYTDRSTDLLEYLSEAASPEAGRASPERSVWSAPRRRSLPHRRYGPQLAAALAAPGALLLLAAAALAALMGLHRAAPCDPESESFLDGIYHICEDYRNRRAQKTANVEICRYDTGDTENTQVANQVDNTSSKSLGVSPSSSLVRPHSPRSSTNLAGCYSRPQPPPYAPLHHRTLDKTPDKRSQSLEESLKLLNEAKIGADFRRDPVVDYNDGSDDYIQMKPDTDYIMEGAVHTELDDIVVPELAKYGLSGIGPI